jgi:hypothetical protein
LRNGSKLIEWRRTGLKQRGDLVVAVDTHQNVGMSSLLQSRLSGSAAAGLAMVVADALGRGRAETAR